jgi:hypothetical protein
MGRHATQLLRLHALKFLFDRAQREETLEVPVDDCIGVLSYSGATPSQVVDCLSYLQANRLIRTMDASSVSSAAPVSISRSGAYYLSILAGRFEYVENVMFDTAIDDESAWSTLSELTARIETEHDIPRRLEHRRERVMAFCDYLLDLEAEVTRDTPLASVACLPKIWSSVQAGVDIAVRGARRNYGVTR